MNGKCAECPVFRRSAWKTKRSIFLLRPGPGREPSEANTTTAPRDETSVEPADAIVCRRCGHEITARSERIVKAGAHAHTFANPEGIVFEIGCFRDAWGCGVVGLPSSEFTWFPDTAWQIAVCVNCLGHLGWRFSATDGSVFHGLILDRIIFQDF